MSSETYHQISGICYQEQVSLEFNCEKNYKILFETGFTLVDNEWRRKVGYLNNMEKPVRHRENMQSIRRRIMHQFSSVYKGLLGQLWSMGSPSLLIHNHPHLHHMAPQHPYDVMWMCAPPNKNVFSLVKFPFLYLSVGLHLPAALVSLFPRLSHNE